MIRWYAALRDDAQLAVQMTTGLLVAASLVGIGTWAVGARLDARAARQAECAARIETFKARNPVLAKGLHMQRYDACADLRVLKGEEP